MFTGLSLDQAPPFKAPLKFFLTAPIFAIIAGLLLLNESIHLHSPHFIASLHFITIGFIVMIAFGALLQMLPVVAGAVIKRSLLLANGTYGLIIFGLLGFSLGFFLDDSSYFFVSSVLLFSGLGIFSYICLYKLFEIEKKSWIIKGMIFSLIGFIIAFLLGIHMLGEYAIESFSSYHYMFANLHYNIIFFGFLFLLIVSISFQVIPMFWVSDAYSQTQQKYILIITVGLLFFYLINTVYELNLDMLYKFFISMVVIYFAFITIYKLYKRKRKLKDISVYFYYSSMIFLILGIFYWLGMSFFTLNSIVFGILLGMGFVMTLMNGMLYKIVPFLTWFHLSSSGIFDIPTMREMISIQKSQLQFFVHLSSLVLLLLGFIFNIANLINLGVILFIVSNALLLIYLLSCAKIYFTKKATHELNTLRSK